MTGWRKKAFVAVAAVQVAVLGWMVAARLVLLATGTLVTLQCEPVDPRSLFSGDYVILNYTVSQFTDEELDRLGPGNKRYNLHDTVYVGLRQKKGDKHWSAVSISRDYEAAAAGGDVVLRGTVSDESPLRVRYGVESYFVPQYRGKQIERELAEVTVDIAVADDGEAAIKTLYISNEPVDFR